jgi:hypothetical protein
MQHSSRMLLKILEAFFHPYYANGNSAVQHRMLETLDKWFGGLGSEDSQKVLQALTKVSFDTLV